MPDNKLAMSAASSSKLRPNLNVAMIGYGFMGKAHSNAWRQVARFFDVAFEPVLKVICGRQEAEVRAAASKFGWLEWATDWRQVVARQDIDVVDICTPGNLHEDIAIAAAQSGKAILCEKPLANTVADAEAMLAAVEKAAVLHMLCHNYRKVPAVALAKQLIAEGKIGTIHHYRGIYLQDWILNPKFPRVWRLDKAVSGSGALGDIAAHSLDLARYLVGEISEVAGMLKTFTAERPLPGDPGTTAPVDVDDAVLSLLRFENGAIGSVEASRVAAGRKNFDCFEINGSRGSIAFNLERMNELELYIEEGPNSGFRTILVTDPSHPYVGAWWPPGHLVGYEHTFTHIAFDFLRALQKQEMPSPNFRDGVAVQRVLSAIERAADSRKWESV